MIEYLDESYDLPASPVSTRYLIASSQRSGSTFLCVELWKTGLLGAPWEYFHPQTSARLSTRWGADDTASYCSALMTHRTTRNGVFGHKLHFSMFADIAFEAPAAHDLLAPHKIIRITRGEKLTQAISLARARQTGAWVYDAAEAACPAYDADLIRRCLSEIQVQELAWEYYARASGLEQLHVTYENLLADPNGVVSRIASFLNVALHPQALIVPTIEIQRDELTETWIRRWRRDHSRAAGPSKR